MKAGLKMSGAVRKRKSTVSIISYSLSRISRSTMAWVLFSLAIIALNATVVATAMIVKKNDVATFKVDIQYVIIIFINIFLFLFTVMNVVKLYSDQLADGSFLLLVSKPYKRFAIFMCQFTAIWIAQIAFILINLSSALLTGFALSQLANVSWLFMTLLKLLLQLAIYTLLFSVVTICGSILLAVMLSTQIVFLILVIFCSLFLMGGMPYSLFKEVANSTQLVLRKKDGSPLVKSVRDIKKVILFKEKLKENKIRYQNVTKKIFDLFEKYPTKMDYGSTAERNKILIDMLDKEMKVYRPAPFRKTINGQIVAWDNYPLGGTINGHTFEINIVYTKYFKSPDDNIVANRLDPNNVYHQEILGMIKEYEELGIALYMKNNIGNAAKLLQLDQIQSSFKVKQVLIDDPSNPGNKIQQDVTSLFKGHGDNDLSKGPDEYFDLFDRQADTYALDEAAKKQYNEIYLNPVPYVLNTLATIVADTIHERDEINNFKVSRNSNLKKYESAMSSYQIINYLNLIEHWNQLWSRLIGEEPFWYDKQEGKFNFESQMNYLLSYEDFPL